MSSEGGMKVMYVVWVWLLVLTIAEVLMAYFHVPPTIMLITLIAMSIGKAFLIMAWFMHLKFERMSLILSLIPAMVACILLMNIFFPDAMRISEIGIWR